MFYGRAGRARRDEGGFMLDSIRSLLDTFPEGVVQVRAGAVLEANLIARRYLPRLVSGASLPEGILLPGEGARGTGTFVFDANTYTYSCAFDGEDCVILFRPAPQTALNGRQLSGMLQQLRELLNQLLAEAGSARPDGLLPAGFSKSFHRLFRLVGNVEYLEQAAGGTGVPFRPVTMDLAGLCGETAQMVKDLLRGTGTNLDYRCKERSLLIPGDPELLQKLLLGLLSNAIRAAEGGEVRLTLRRQGDRAYVTAANSGQALNGRTLAALLQEGPEEGLPLPGQGAGLGLAIARHIVTLHGGSLLTQLDGAPKLLVSLPAGPLNGRVSVRTPNVQRDGGLHPVMVELSDVLPAALYGMEEMD